MNPNQPHFVLDSEQPDAPEGFADRVIDRLQQRQKKRRLRTLQQTTAVAILALVATFGITANHDRRQRLEAEHTRQQFATAIELTNHSLSPAERTVAHLDRRRN